MELDHHEMSKKYKENLKQNQDDMVRKLDYRGTSSAETEPRVSNAAFDNQTCNCMMATSATQTGDVGINGNLDSPDLDGPPVPPPPLVTNTNLSSIYHGDWPIDRILWNSAPSSYGEMDSLSGLLTQETSSLMSWSSTGSTTGVSSHGRLVVGSGSGARPLGTKVEMVYSLLSMLGAHDKDDMSKTLLAMSQSPESCIAMRQSGCLPLLIQLLHGTDEGNGTIPEDGGQAQRARTREARRRASQALHRIVHAQADDKRGRRETRVLRLLEQIREYCDTLREIKGQEAESGPAAQGVEVNAGPAMAALMKLSFDEEHRNAMCQLGGLHAIAELIEVDQFAHGSTSDQFSVTLIRYAGIALTNLTSGDGNNRAALCSMKPFMYALVAQLHSPGEDLRQVMASVLRNLSWRADSRSKQLLREVGAVGALMGAAMEATKESTLKSVLSALWNLSAHCSANKADICSFQGSLAFLVDTLNHPSPAIIENGGGILRNISSHIAVHEEYRTVLRRHNCLQILLEHLKSSSLTVVSNTCGTLWNLSARCAEDQKALWDMGAVGMLRNLVHSKHKMISMGSSAALKNLLSANPAGRHEDMAISQRAFSENDNMPSLMTRKQKALEKELDQNLPKTFDNIDSPKTSPAHDISLDNRLFFSSNNRNFPPYYSYLPGRMYFSVHGQISNYPVPRFESRKSIGSTHSEPIHPHHRPIYHSFSNNSRYMSVDHRYYGYPDFDRTNYFHTNHATPGRPLSEVSHPEKLDNFAYNERYMLMSEMKRRSEYLRREAETNAVLQDNQPGDKQKQASASTCPDHLVPAHNTGNLCPSKDVQEMTKRFEGVSLGSNKVQDQAIDYSCKCVDDNSKVAKKKQVKDALKIKEYRVVKNEQNTQEKSFTSEHLQHHQWQHLNSASFHPYNHKQTKMALRESGQECTLQHINSGYTETDLDGPDQLTDFSQMYKEHMDTAEDFEAPRTMPEDLKDSAFYDDSLKVYCTEGTPLNFSTASSLTDLREIHLSNLDAEANKRNEKSKPKIAFGKPARGGHMKSAAADIDFNKNRIAEESIIKEEGSGKHVCPVKKPSLGEKEAVPGKSVTFGEEVNYSMETPLMFSRCSSLGSLSSFEQQSIHDDRSSVISDFSRRTSEVVSPSDLPDSPSQTMPPSPHRTKHSPGVFQFPPSHARLSGDALLHFRKARQAGEDSSEDSVKLYADENTPGNISGATSLSSLTIDDQPKIQKERSLSNIHKSPILDEKEEMIAESSDEIDMDKDAMLSPDNSPGKTSSKHDSMQGSSSGDNADEEDMLAKYKIPGMPGHNGNSSILHSRINDLGSPSNLKAAKSSLLAIASSVVKGKVPLAQSSTSGTNTSTPVKYTNLDVAADEVKIYQTEGTPLALSHATSLSDLSIVSGADSHALSFRSENQSDSSMDSEDEKILQQCIQAGKPQSKNQIPTLFNRYSMSHSVESDSQEMEQVSLAQSQIPSTVPVSDFSLVSGPDSHALSFKSENQSDSSIDSEDEKILQQCIQAGMPHSKGKIQTPFNCYSISHSLESDSQKMEQVSLTKSQISSTVPVSSGPDSRALSFKSENLSDSSIDSEDEKILQQCIQAGMPHPKSKIPTSFNCYTMSHSISVSHKMEQASLAKSQIPSTVPVSDLSIVSEPDTCALSFKSENQSDSSIDSEDEKILQQCIQAGMPHSKSTIPTPFNCYSVNHSLESDYHEMEQVSLAKSQIPSNVPVSNLSIISGPDSRMLSFKNENQSDSSIDSEDEKILQQCIQAGMPHSKSKIPTLFNRYTMSHSVESDSHEMEQVSLAKYRIPSTVPVSDFSLVSGPDSRGMSFKSENQSDSSIDSEDEKILQQCIQAGMPHSRSKIPTSLNRRFMSHSLESGSHEMGQISMAKSRFPSTVPVSDLSVVSGPDSRALSFNSENQLDSSIDSKDEKILRRCIQAGMPHLKSKIPTLFNRSSMSHSVESDSHEMQQVSLAKSQILSTVPVSDLSNVSGPDSRVLSFKSKNQLDSSIDSKDEKILRQCIQAGMPHLKSNIPTLFNRYSMSNSVESDSHEMEQVSLAKSQIPSTVRDLSTVSGPDSRENQSDSSFDSEDEKILQQCIQAGMPNPKSEIPTLFNRYTMGHSVESVSHEMERVSLAKSKILSTVPVSDPSTVSESDSCTLSFKNENQSDSSFDSEDKKTL